MGEMQRFMITTTDSQGVEHRREMTIPRGMNPVSALLTVLQAQFGPGRVVRQADGLFQWIPEEKAKVTSG